MDCDLVDYWYFISVISGGGFWIYTFLFSTVAACERRVLCECKKRQNFKRIFEKSIRRRKCIDSFVDQLLSNIFKWILSMRTLFKNSFNLAIWICTKIPSLYGSCCCIWSCLWRTVFERIAALCLMVIFNFIEFLMTDTGAWP